MFRAILQAHCLTLKAAGERGAGLAPQSRDCSPAGELLSDSSTLYGKSSSGKRDGAGGRIGVEDLDGDLYCVK